MSQFLSWKLEKVWICVCVWVGACVCIDMLDLEIFQRIQKIKITPVEFQKQFLYECDIDTTRPGIN